jgi:Flp pilus assembly protein TadD
MGGEIMNTKLICSAILSIFLVSCASDSKKPEVSPQKVKKQDEIIGYGQEENEVIEVAEVQMNEESLEDQLKKALEKNNFEDVKLISAKLLSRDESNVYALNALGVLNYKEKKYGIASIFWNRVLKKDPENSSALNNLGVIAIREKRDSDAIVLFKKAIRYNSDNVAALGNLGSLYLKYYNFKAAEASLDIAYSDYKKDPYFLSNYAVARQGTGRSGLSRMKDAMDMQKKNVDLGMNYASMLVFAEKDLTEAEILLTQMKLLTPAPKDLVRLSRIQKSLDELVARKRKEQTKRSSKK